MLGKPPTVARLLVQLQTAGIDRVLVQCGYMGQEIEDSIRRTLPSEVRAQLEIQFMQLGNGCLRVHSLRQATEFLRPDDPIRIQRTAYAPLQAGAEEAYALVGTDFVTVVGVPATVYTVCAELFACSCTVFDHVDALATGEAVYFTMADVLAGYVTSFPNSLRYVATDKEVFFAAMTKDTLTCAISSGLRDIGIISDNSWLQDGPFNFERKPIHTGPVSRATWPGGSGWSSFSVKRRRDAVYVTTKYFSDYGSMGCRGCSALATGARARRPSGPLAVEGCRLWSWVPCTATLGPRCSTSVGSGCGTSVGWSTITERTDQWGPGCGTSVGWSTITESMDQWGPSCGTSLGWSTITESTDHWGPGCGTSVGWSTITERMDQWGPGCGTSVGWSTITESTDHWGPGCGTSVGWSTITEGTDHWGPGCGTSVG